MGLADVTGHGWVGKCFFDTAPVLGAGKLQCAEFLVHAHRSARNVASGSVTVLCDFPTSDRKFKGTVVSGFSILGKTATFTVAGSVYATPANIPTIATISVTDNGSSNDALSITLKAGSKTLCSAGNTVSGDVTILVGPSLTPVSPVNAGAAVVEHLISSSSPRGSQAPWPLLIFGSLLLAGTTLMFRRWRVTRS